MSDDNKPGEFYEGSLVPNSNTFMGADQINPLSEEWDTENADVGVVGLPWDEGSITRTGQNMGPNALRLASDQFLYYHYDHDTDLSEHYEFVDCGDVPIIPGDVNETFDRTRTILSRLLDAEMIPVMLGGNHAIPIPGFNALAEHVADFGIVLFDSHLDTAPDVGGYEYNHASPIPRAIDEAGVDPENIALVGINGMLNPSSEIDYVEEHGINVYPLDEIIRRGPVAVGKDVAEVVNDGTDAVYVSWDHDVLDSAHTPGTSAPTPNGMTTRELVQMLNVVGSDGIDAIDIAETSPGWDPSGSTSRVGVRVILELLTANATGASNAPGLGTEATRYGHHTD